MKIKNSYIFLDNPCKKDKHKNNITSGCAITLDLGRSVYSYLKSSFPNITKSGECDNIFKSKYICMIKTQKYMCHVEFILTQVVGVNYLDVYVECSNKIRGISCLELVQNTLFTSGIKDEYIDIVSYDAISEYYCNKIYVKLNMLERNMRQLLFNIYILNFGKDYYQATVDADLQGKIKGLINSNSSKDKRNEIKKQYGVSSSEAENIDRLQQFFYSFEFADVQKLLFKPSWTSVDELNRRKFLEENNDLTKMSDDELRRVILQFSPKSDWDRFFSEKIKILNIENLIDEIRTYRNIVAHNKFLNKSEYEKCKKLINILNKAVVEAIKLTEEHDFADKNAEALNKALAGLSEKINSVLAPIRESVEKLYNSKTWQAVCDISKKFESMNISKHITSLYNNDGINRAIESWKKSADSISAAMSWAQSFPLKPFQDNIQIAFLGERNIENVILDETNSANSLSLGEKDNLDNKD